MKKLNAVTTVIAFFIHGIYYEIVESWPYGGSSYFTFIPAYIFGLIIVYPLITLVQIKKPFKARVITNHFIVGVTALNSLIYYLFLPQWYLYKMESILTHALISFFALWTYYLYRPTLVELCGETYFQWVWDRYSNKDKDARRDILKKDAYFIFLSVATFYTYRALLINMISYMDTYSDQIPVILAAGAAISYIIYKVSVALQFGRDDRIRKTWSIMLFSGTLLVMGTLYFFLNGGYKLYQDLSFYYFGIGLFGVIYSRRKRRHILKEISEEDSDLQIDVN